MRPVLRFLLLALALLPGAALAQGGPARNTTYAPVPPPPAATSTANNIGAAGKGPNSDITALYGLTTPLYVSEGGTGVATLPAHGVVVGEDTANVAVVVPGTSGTVLTSAGISSDPYWQAVVSSLAAGTGLKVNATTGAVTVSLKVPVTVANGGTGATAAGRTAANNIGAAALGANSDITSLSGLTTPLPATEGGTGVATLPAHGVVLGAGTSALAAAVPGAAGTVLTSNGPSADPSWQAPPAASHGQLIGLRVFTSSATYTPTAGTNSIIVEALGGGGAGGGCPATGAGQLCAAGGGGSGAHAIGSYASGFPGAVVTIGAAGGPVAGGNGGDGGTTSFGALLTAPGGRGGLAGAATSGSWAAVGGAGGGAGTGGLLNGTGTLGQTGMVVSNIFLLSGAGAGSPFGGGGPPNGGSGTGYSAAGYGAGGGGAAVGPSAPATAGGSGTGGAVLVWEFN